MENDPKISNRVIYEDNATALLTAHRVKILIASAVLLAAVSYFALQAFQSATAYYLTVSELVERGVTVEGQSIRVNGKLVEGSFERHANSTLAIFSITDGVHTIVAQHEGVVPDLFFNDHSELILQGTYDPEGLFHSHSVIVKCPSKYIAVE